MLTADRALGWRRILSLAVLATSALSSAAAARPLAPPTLRSRYVSSQAYYHALKAELLLLAADTAGAAAELQLALVYDSESPHLSVRLSQVALQLGQVDKAARLADRALGLDPAEPLAYLLRARAHLDKGERAQAERVLKRALDRRLDCTACALELGRTYGRTGRVKEAVQVLLASAEDHPRSVAELLLAAQLELERRRVPAAEALLERALGRSPADLGALDALADLHERQLRYAEVSALLSRQAERAPDDVELALRAARAELLTGAEAAAGARLEALAARGSVELDARVGALWLDEGYPERAWPLLAAVLAARPAEGELRLRYAEALARAGKLEEALAELESQGPEQELYEESRLRAAELLLEQGLLERARLLLSGALAKRPGSEILLGQYALVLERGGDRPQALAALRGGPAASPAGRTAGGAEERGARPLPASLAPLEAELLVRGGERDRGIGALRQRVAETGPMDEELIHRLALLEESAGEAAAAGARMERLLKASPESTLALNFLGYSLALRGQGLEEAEGLLRRAVFLSPRSPAVLDSLAFCLARRGRHAEAERLFARAARLSHADPEISEHWAQSLEALGRLEDARQALTRAQEALERRVRARVPEAPAALARVARRLAELPSRPRSKP